MTITALVHAYINLGFLIPLFKWEPIFFFAGVMMYTQNKRNFLINSSKLKQILLMI